jgi:hypothetical protein
LCGRKRKPSNAMCAKIEPCFQNNQRMQQNRNRFVQSASDRAPPKKSRAPPSRRHSPERNLWAEKVRTERLRPFVFFCPFIFLVHRRQKNLWQKNGQQAFAVNRLSFCPRFFCLTVVILAPRDE